MTAKRIEEQGSLGDITGEVFPIRIITEGEGSTGIYRRDLIETQSSAFNGSLMFMGHPADVQKPWERGADRIIGKLVQEVTVREDEEGRMAAYSAVAFHDPKTRDFVREYRDQLAVSIYIASEGTEDPETGKYVVESLNGNDPYKSVDIVVAAGRGGRFERASEALREISEDNSGSGGNADTVNKEKRMDELVKLVEALIAKVETLSGEITSLKTLSESANAEKVTELDSVIETAKDAVAKVTEANLPEVSVGRVFEGIKAGKSVEVAVKEEADYFKAVSEASGKTLIEGRSVIVTDDATHDYSTSWGV